MKAWEYQRYPLTALWLLANARDNWRDRWAVTAQVVRIAQGKVTDTKAAIDMIRKALRQRLEMYGAWAI